MAKENKSSWKWQLAEGLIELAVCMSALALGFVILLLLSGGDLEGISSEVIEIFMLVGMIALAIVCGFVFLIIHIVKSRRRSKDVRTIYKRLRDRYKLSLMTVTRKVNGEMTDIPIIRGRSDKGRFEVYKEGDVYIFSADYTAHFTEDKHIRPELKSVDDAVICIEEFMTSEI